MKGLFLAVLGLAAIGYLVVAGVQVHRFSRISQPAEGVVEAVSVEKTGSDRFQLRVSYLYEGLEGEALLPSPLFRNEWAAESYAKEFERVAIWYDGKHPERSTLQHVVPYKACLYALIMLGIFLYFLWMVRSSRLNRLV